MKNFINSRIKGVKDDGMISSIIHNIRSKSSRNDINGKLNYVYDLETNTRYELDHEHRENNKMFLQVLRKKYKNDRKIHNALYKKRRKQNLKNFHGSWGEGVLTFSEAIHRDMGTKYTSKEWEQSCIEAIKESCEYLGTYPIYVSFHYSETTPHCHYHFKNFTNQDDRSITHKFRSEQHLSTLQDIAFKHLKKLGMQRGIKKEISGRTKHKTTKQYHEEQIRKLNFKLYEKQELLQTTLNELVDAQNELKTIYTNIGTKKNELKDIRQQYQRSDNEYKKLSISIKSLQQQEQYYRNQSRELKEKIKSKKDELGSIEMEIKESDSWRKDTKKELKNFILEHTSKNGSKKYEIKDINKFYKEVVDLVEYVSNFDLKLTELNQTKHKLDAANNKVQFSEDKYKKLYSFFTKLKTDMQNTNLKLDEKVSAIDDLNTKISDQDEHIEYLEQIINELDSNIDIKSYIDNLKSKDEQIDIE
jgi:predicted  nucleic acid-binding Zn-ribbon protein